MYSQYFLDLSTMLNSGLNSFTMAKTSLDLDRIINFFLSYIFSERLEKNWNSIETPIQFE